MAPSSTFDPVEFKQNIRTEWRSAADGWRRWLDVVEGPEGGQRHSARLIELAELRPGDRVLDVGGGYGEPSLSAARVVGPEGRVVCTDISAEMLATARERADATSLSNIEFIESDAEELDLEDGSFAAVLSRATLMFLPDVAGTLKRLHRFLEPGGRLAASVWGPVPAVQFAAAFPVVAQELELPSLQSDVETVPMGYCVGHIRRSTVPPSMTTGREGEGTMSRRLGIDTLTFTTRPAGGLP